MKMATLLFKKKEMSRGFVKEEDQEETPITPPRAALPSGAINYVTPIGMQQLRAERKELENEKTKISKTDEGQYRRDIAAINLKLSKLQERIISARILNPIDQPKNEVRFGAKVTYKIIDNNSTNSIQIVGVDEADIKESKIAFVAPIAVAINGRKVGEVIDFSLGEETNKLEILNIEY